MTDDDEVRYESVFRTRWRERQAAGVRPGELIRQPRWLDVALVALGVLVVGGGVAASTMTVARTEALPAVAQGTSVTAVRGGGPSPLQGSDVEYRDFSGTTYGAKVVEVTATEVLARLDHPGPASAGELVVPAAPQPLISVLLPRLG